MELPTALTLEEARQGTLQLLNQEYITRLEAVSHDGRLFDLSGSNKDLVNDWRDGAVETDALLGAGAWGPESWPHMADGGEAYVIADVTACRTWALSMFICYAAIYKARNAHAAAINAMTETQAARLYDVTINWPG